MLIAAQNLTAYLIAIAYFLWTGGNMYISKLQVK